MERRSTRRAGALVVVALLATFLAACSRTEKGPPPIKNDVRWTQYVSEHSGGLVSRTAQLRIRFAVDVIDASQVGRPIDGLVTLDQSVALAAVFDNPRELALVPDQPLPSGARLRATLRINKLKSLPAALGDFHFEFDVLPMSADVLVDSLDNDTLRPDHMILRGMVLTTDVAEADAVEAMLTARLGDKALQPDWQHDPDGRAHRFTIRGLVRGDAAQKIDFTWDAARLGGSGTGATSIDVPARGSFEVMRVQPVTGEETRIDVEFSEELDRKQNLNGLVALSSGGFTVRIDGNTLHVHPEEPPIGDVEISIAATLRATDGRRLGNAYKRSVSFETLKPQVRLVGGGVILPDAERLTVPFEALNVASVQVTAFKVYDTNLGQFLQVNALGGTSELKRVGRYLWRRTIPLGAGGVNKWRRFAFDVTDLFERDPGGLYRLTISINRGNSLYACSDADKAVPVPVEEPLRNGDEYEETDSSGWDAADSEDYYYWDRPSGWEDRNNPCKDAYYRMSKDVKASRNFIAANIGLIAKQGSDETWHLVTTDIRSGHALGGVKVRLFNYQNRELITGSSDDQGFLRLRPEVKPFYAVAERGDQRGYLKLSAGLALPVSHFDVGGVSVQRGLKGSIYGERGVWRPGDVMHLTFVLKDPADVVPAGHPATLELVNPTGQLVHSRTVTDPVGDFYHFAMPTAESDQTGTWRAIVRLGGQAFERAVKIETVMPNRLKLELDTGKEALRVDRRPAFALFGQWLHGASAAGLRATVGVRLKPRATGFSRNSDFTFDDPTRTYAGDEQVLFDGPLGGDGYVRFSSDILAEQRPAGLLAAEFTSRVFEPGGAFSIARSDGVFHPYGAYVGIKLPKGDVARNMLLTDTPHTVEIASLDPTGEPVGLDEVELTVHKLEWRWWWDKGADSLANFETRQGTTRIAEGKVATSAGKGTWQFEIKYPDWGRYLVRACDSAGGHCAGRIVYVDWPGWAGRAQEQKGPGASALTLYADKSRYTVGETATINLPPATKGRALISLENGSGILEQRWLVLEGARASFDLPITSVMAPNAYVSVTLVQPHEGKDNDRPIRLYGVLPLLVTDPATHLSPSLTTPAEVRPGATFNVEVAERDGRAMTYTVAIVDEGLLGLTGFRTPVLHDEFYRREALGVRTWDMFDEVVGAYGGALERLLALGGSDDGPLADDAKDKKRFPPVVKFLGPFRLAAGTTARHEVTLPPYVGAVRTMVVAGADGAFGSAERSMLVKQPLMVQATLPRVLGPGEELRVPVSVFVLDESIRDVELSVSADQRLSVVGDAKVALQFKGSGDELGFLRLKVGDRLGKARVKFVASAGKERAEHVIDIEVRPSNPEITRVQRGIAEPNRSLALGLTPLGLPGTNQTSLEVSSVPALNLNERLQFLIRYPYGCVEQTTSAAFPQVYLGKLLALEEGEQKRTQQNVEAAIERLRSFQQPDGSFAYWPGGHAHHDWATNYVGHFLVEAKRAGFSVPANLLASWRAHQKARAQSYLAQGRDAALDQAYRLYVLALSGAAELGAMNRLREQDSLPNVARWMLAAAYHEAGLADVARQLAAGGDLTVSRYDTEGLTFGSDLRDRAILLTALVTLDDAQRAGDLAVAVSEGLNDGHWHSTQSLSWALTSLGRMVGADGAPRRLSFEYVVDGGAPQRIDADKPVHQLALKSVGDKPTQVEVRNPTGGRLFINLANRGIPPVGEERASSDGLSMKVEFTDADGTSTDIDALPQGRDVRVRVTVRNTSERHLENLALTQLLPSGWELETVRSAQDGESAFDYRDFRDDRMNTYFPLRSGEERTFLMRFTATYPGRYYLPGWSVEAMYDAKRHARTTGRWVTVRDTARGESER